MMFDAGEVNITCNSQVAKGLLSNIQLQVVVELQRISFSMQLQVCMLVKSGEERYNSVVLIKSVNIL